MRPQWTGVMALAVSSIAAVALAHTGAMGVVLDRMNGMTAMRDNIAELAPMMQGTVPYDTFIVSEGASVIAGHAGKTVLSIFPENSLNGATSAKPEIWSDWQEFASLSEDLKASVDALAKAAPNGLNPAAAPPGERTGMDPSTMTMTEAPERAQGFMVAGLLGYGETQTEITVTRGTSDPATLAFDLTTLAADDLFSRISATCSSSHPLFCTGRT